MADSSIGQIQSTARILLICPDCGHENSEYADLLRSGRSYYCRGDGCDYIFDLAGPRLGIGQAFVDACKRFYAAFYTMRGRACAKITSPPERPLSRARPDR